MRTLKFKAQPTNVFFAAANQMFGGSSTLPTTAERAVIKSLSCRKLGGASKHLIDGSEKRICRLSFNFRFRMLLKGAVNMSLFPSFHGMK